MPAPLATGGQSASSAAIASQCKTQRTIAVIRGQVLKVFKVALG